jgi:hypothetical protein
VEGAVFVRVPSTIGFYAAAKELHSKTGFDKDQLSASIGDSA